MKWPLAKRTPNVDPFALQMATDKSFKKTTKYYKSIYKIVEGFLYHIQQWNS